MRGSQLRRLLESARADRRGQTNFRESVRLRNGTEIRCQGKEEYNFWEGFRAALDDGSLKPEEFSVRDLFESLVEGGREIADSWNPRHGGGGVVLYEAGNAVNTGDFSNIMGQITYTRLLEGYQQEEFRFTQLIPSQNTPFDGEKIAGIAGLGDEGEVVGERESYPTVGISEDWIETPVTTKRGLIVPVTKEAIFFDRTGRILSEAGQVGNSLGIGKEKRAIDCVIDENRTVHRYKWRGTSYATYQTATPWDNVTAANGLTDWTDLDNAEQTVNAITDPNTGEPIVLDFDIMIVTKQNEKAAQRIANSTEITVVTPGFATTGNPTETRVANPYRGAFQVITSRQLATRLATDTDWFWGRPSNAFLYMQNWPITVVRAPVNSEDEFKRDIVAQFKASERGEFTTVDPRMMSKSTVA